MATATSWTMVGTLPMTYTASHMTTSTNSVLGQRDFSGAYASLDAMYDPRRWYYENKLDLIEAAILEFTPTSLHRSWMGKFRCMWCKKSGYTWDGCLSWTFWWGQRHGKNCRKRP